MDGTARGYAASLERIAPILDLRLHEVDDWNCCGATEFLSIGPLRGLALVARNLALAERESAVSRTLVAPCSQCFVNLAKADASVREGPVLAGRVNDALDAGGLRYTPGSVDVRHLFDIIALDVGVDAVREKVRHPLRGLRVAPYLGCLVTRPDVARRWRAREQPRSFDVLIEALGADIVDYPLRTECCGGHLSQISPDTGLSMIRRLVETAGRLGADLIAVVCPMCQMNLDLFQGEANVRVDGTSIRIPILFFTQLMGLAFGIPAAELGIGSETVSARAALAKVGIEAPDGPGDGTGGDGTPARQPRQKRGPELPMPAPRGDGGDAR
jgi:heterodisulfide reductase subunit B